MNDELQRVANQFSSNLSGAQNARERADELDRQAASFRTSAAEYMAAAEMCKEQMRSILAGVTPAELKAVPTAPESDVLAAMQAGMDETARTEADAAAYRAAHDDIPF